jgi:PiT family inorganic phosphate transporter
MSLAFVTYLVLKGFKHVWPSIVSFVNETFFAILPVTKKPTFLTALILGLIVSIIIFFWIRHSLAKENLNFKNDRKSINTLFTIPLIFAAALLSFAHGANDVANAIGPLAAISDAVTSGGISAKAGIPLWVMAVGAIGISVGLALYGPKLIKTVGSEITELDQVRAFSIAIAAAITVIIASQLGLPVSSTHIAVGGVFGVGFLREWLDSTDEADIIAEREAKMAEEEKTLQAYHQELETLEAKSEKKKSDYQRIVSLYKLIEDMEEKIKRDKKALKSVMKTKYVKRDAVKKIIAAWVITVPAAAILSALIFFMIKGIAV